VSVLTFIESATDEQVRAIESALATLPARIPSLRAYAFGSDLGLSADGNADFAVVADFDDIAGYESYRDDPEHRRILAEHIRPILAGRAAAQYEWS
jgi:hypothetical protein